MIPGWPRLRKDCKGRPNLDIANDTLTVNNPPPAFLTLAMCKNSSVKNRSIVYREGSDFN